MYYTKAMSTALFGKGVVSSKTKGIVKSEADLSNYTAEDFLKYWKSKAKSRDVNYVTVKYKDKAILKSLLKNFSCVEIKMMMDYLWDSGEPINLKDGKLPYPSYGLFLLSGGFLSPIYNRAKWWKDGIKETPVRGWENDGKDSVTIEF